MTKADKPDPSTFPQYPRWATWVKDRSPQFKMHNTLGMAKNAISGRPLRRGGSRYAIPGNSRSYESQLEGGYVFEYVYDPELGDGSWVERWHVPEGAWKSEHDLWKIKAPSAKQIKPVPQKSVDAAIASITEAWNKE